MIFKSSEIRWFSKEKVFLWNLFEKLSEKGAGIREDDRTDFYLKSTVENTGIKIRQENHELKVKCSDDEDLGYGMMEHWIKWSRSEEKNILNTVSGEFLGDWLAVDKIRWKKRYEIKDGKKVMRIQEEFVDEGCGAEFTEIYIPETDMTLYTFGFEAFSASDKERGNLLLSLSGLNLNTRKLRDLDSYGYPRLLKEIGEKQA